MHYHNRREPKLAKAMEVLFLLALITALRAGRSLTPNVSTTAFGRNGQHRQPPLAVLRAGASGGGSQSLPDLEVLSEDPDWAHKVRRVEWVTAR